MIVALTGFMASGKTTFGRAAAERLGWAFVDLDELIAARHGTPAEIFAAGGEGCFREIESQMLDEALAAEHDTVLALGGGALTLPAARELIFSRTRCVWLRARLETIRQRLGDADASRPLFANADALYARREPLYAQAPFAVDTDGRTPDAVASAILTILK